MRAAGVPASRANSCLVYLNGTFYGVYTNVETIDKHFLRLNFASDEGNLYEETGPDLVAGAEQAYELETNEDEDDRSDLAGLIAALDRATPETFVAELEQVLALDEYLRFAAIDALVSNHDGYNFGDGPRNNFRLYHDPSTGLFHFIPSGMDRSIQPRVPEDSTSEWVGEVELVSIWDATGRILVGCIESDACRGRWLQTVAEMSDLFVALDLETRELELGEQIRADVRADDMKRVDDAHVERAQEEQRAFIVERPAAVRSEM
jgi:spore coat protein CotH